MSIPSALSAPVALMSTKPQSEAKAASPEPLDPDGFYRQLRVVTLSLLLLWLVIHFLREYKLIFQPLLVAVLFGYLILPLHHWLAARGVPSLLAYVAILLAILAVLFGIGTLVFQSLEQVMNRLPTYEEKLDSLYRRALQGLAVEDWERMHVRDLAIFKEMGSVDQVVGRVHSAVGTFANFFMGLAVTFVYLIFLIAERESFHRRLARAVGDERARQIFAMAGSINLSVAQYLAVKTFIGALAAILSLIVLAAFGVDFYILWAILIFVFNYIPYLGSLAAVAMPVALSFLQLESVLAAVVVAVLLVGIQQGTGTFLEPRMAGRRLDVSPLLILLSLTFWGLIWGVVGMILAVPLLVVIKTVLENIDATKPLAVLMSNQ